MSFLNKPNGYYVADDISNLIISTLPAGFYSVQWDAQASEFYLSSTTPFTINHKIYGKSNQWSDRIINTYYQRSGKATTAAFVGEKGSGKSLLLKQIAITFVEKMQGIVLLIDQPYSGTAFNKFLQSIRQEKIAVIDEFEKVYSDQDHRNAMLSLFDGTWPQHTLFLLTANTSLYSRNLDYFNNRPGRVYFNIEFKSLDLELLKEYSEDNLIDKSRMTELLSFIGKFDTFNIDMLSVLISEMNQYPEESISELTEILNIKPQTCYDNISINVNVVNTVTGYVYKPNEFQNNSHCLYQFLRHEAKNWNIYTTCDDLKDEDEFDVFVSHEDSIITQNPSTNDITITYENLEITIKVNHKSLLTPAVSYAL